MGVQRSETAAVAAAVTRFLQLDRHLVAEWICDPDPIRTEALLQLEPLHPHNGFATAEALLCPTNQRVSVCVCVATTAPKGNYKKKGSYLCKAGGRVDTGSQFGQAGALTLCHSDRSLAHTDHVATVVYFFLRDMDLRGEGVTVGAVSE